MNSKAPRVLLTSLEVVQPSGQGTCGVRDAGISTASRYLEYNPTCVRVRSAAYTLERFFRELRGRPDVLDAEVHLGDEASGDDASHRQRCCSCTQQAVVILSPLPVQLVNSLICR